MPEKYAVDWAESGSVSPVDGNVDVYVTLENGRVFSATFFALGNIALLLERYRHTGECCSGLYLWASNMIIVSTLTKESVRSTIADLMASGEFEVAFAPA